MDNHILEQAIYQTVRYFDIFSTPVTATQIWRCLIIEDEDIRWGGHSHYTLGEIAHMLKNSEWLQSRLDTTWGYYFLQGKQHLVRQRLVRHSIAQDKLKIVQRAAKYMAFAPFVRSLSVSGSLAMGSTSRSSDLDVFVITSPKRIWTTRLGLLTVSQLLGRRRKYWDQEAPDKVCLNHYVSQEHLELPKDVRSIYTAVLYTLLVPLYGSKAMHAFQYENTPWIRGYVMAADIPDVGHYSTIQVGMFMTGLKRLLEGILLEPIGDSFELFAERLQRFFIRKHMQHESGRVALSKAELAFHPDTKAPAIVAAFEQDPAQGKLL